MASVGDSPWRLSHLWEPIWRPSFQGRLGCKDSVHGCLCGVKLVLGLHQECFEVVKLMMELHYMSQGGDQREEFWNGRATIWDLPYESRG